MDVISILKQDYQKFPADQTYSIYAENVYFEDPLNKFHGIGHYQKMIGFMNTWFNDIQLDLHDISQSENAIKTRWTLSWTASVPWKPRMKIPGWSELQLNADGLIESHIDYWDISRLDVLKQVFLVGNR